MAKTKQQKTKDLEELTSKLKEAKGVVFAGFRGTTVKDIDRFRRSAEKQGVSTKVYKLTLLQKALEDNKVENAKVDYKLPVLVAAALDEETLPARLLKDLAKEVKTLEILGGVLDGKFSDKAQAVALADLPSKQELQGMLVRTIHAPVPGFVNVLAANLRSLVQVLSAVATK